MKTPLLTLLLLSFVVRLSAQTITLTAPPNGGNQKSSVSQWIGLASVTITYHGPDVHDPAGADRKGHIWGELVPYGLQDPGFGTSLASPWRTGSNEITTITLSHDVKINGKELKAGTYGLFLLLEKDKPSTWIFSRNSTSWGSYYYTSTEDVLRVEATLEDACYTEWLTYTFEDRQSSTAKAYLNWENKRIGFTIEVTNSMQLYVDQIRAELTSYAGFNYINWVNAARFCLTNKINLEEALTWIDISMNTERFNGNKTFSAMRIKANLLTALKRDTEAAAVMKEALGLDPSVQELHEYGRYLLGAGQPEQALTIFKMNRERHPSDNFTTYVGLARAYTALGNKKEAIKNWEIAIRNIPESQKQNLEAYKAELAKLK